MWTLPQTTAAWTPHTRNSWRVWIAQAPGNGTDVERIITEELVLPDDWTGPEVTRTPRAGAEDLALWRLWLSGSGASAYSLPALAAAAGLADGRAVKAALERIIERLRVALRMNLREPIMLVRETPSGPGRNGRTGGDRNAEWYAARGELMLRVREQLDRLAALVMTREAHRLRNGDLEYLEREIRDLADEFPDDDEDE